LDANLGYAKSALTRFFSPEFKKLLVDTGLENHPELIRGLVKVGKEISEDRLPGGSPRSAPQPKAPENILFDNK